MYIRDIAIYADKSIVDFYGNGFCYHFHEHTCCIVAFILSKIYRKVETNAICKLSFDLYHHKVCFDSTPSICDGVLSFPAEFDFDTYNSPNCLPNCKKQMIATFLRQSLETVCSKNLWDYSPFQSAFDSLEQEKYIITMLSKKSWMSPNRKFKVSIVCNYDITEAVFDVVLVERKTRREICRKFLGEIRPSEDLLYEVKKNCKWRSETVFETTSGGFADKIFSVDFTNEMMY
jgi:hypothetical protein